MVRSPLTYTFQGGRLYQEVVSITLANNTVFILNHNIPAGKRRVLLSYKLTNPDDVARTVRVKKFKDTARTIKIKELAAYAGLGAAGEAQWPHGVPSAGEQKEGARPVELFEFPNVLQFTWEAGGASAGGTDADGLVIEWLETDV